jgi:hypothetical protein
VRYLQPLQPDGTRERRLRRRSTVTFHEKRLAAEERDAVRGFLWFLTEISRVF